MTGADLLKHLHRGGGAAYLWAAWPDKRKESLWFPVGKQLPAIPAAWASANIYFGVHPTATMFGKNERSKIATVLAVNCLFAEFDGKDFDGDKAAILSHIEALWDHGDGLPFPSVIIDSGGGFHCYWLLENIVTIDDGNREHLKALQAAWVDLVGGDPASKDLARVLRLPGTVNRKYDPPRPVTFIEGDERRLYSLDTFEQFTNLDETAHAAHQAAAATTDKQPDDVIASFNQSHPLVDLLKGARYTLAWERGNVTRLVRPGGASASVVVFADTNRSFHHSSSDPLHTSGHTRDAFDCWTRLVHNGDAKAAWTAAKKAQGKWEAAPVKVVGHDPSPDEAQDQPNGEALKVRLTDLGNAWRFARQHRQNFRFTAGRGWLSWDGKRWTRDIGGAVQRAAKQTVTSLYTEAAEAAATAERLAAAAGDEKATDEQRAKLGDLATERAKAAQALVGWAKQCQSRGRIESIIALGASELPIAARDDAFDVDSWLLNCENGTLNLRSGALQPHRQNDMLTALCPTVYNPTATCPTWDKFLHRIMGGNDALIGFLRRMAGYCLTGDVSEQVLFFMHGSGSNGKTTFINALFEILGGDYATSAPPDLLIAKQGDRHPTEIADLQGKRLVASVEVEDGRRMAEGLVKQLTGGDMLKARYMREDFFQFRPTHKLFLIANHRPVIRGTDYAIWRRIRLIPFEVTIAEAEKDPHLSEKLRAESAGILAWAVRGCLEWQRIGLAAPQAVMAATEAYKNESDTLGAFLAECTVRVGGAQTKAGALYAAYKTWAEQTGVHPVNMMRFGLALAERGNVKETTRTGVIYGGIGLLAEPKPVSCEHL